MNVKPYGYSMMGAVMNEKLIAGYAAYTTADEFGAAASGDAPATTPVFGVSLASLGLSVNFTWYAHC